MVMAGDSRARLYHHSYNRKKVELTVTRVLLECPSQDRDLLTRDTVARKASSQKDVLKRS